MTDEELKKAADNHIRKVVDIAGHPGWDWTTQDIADAFLAGAEWKDRSLNWIRDLVKAAIKKPEEAQGILERIDRMLNKEEEQ